MPIRFVNYLPAQIEALADRVAESSLPTRASPECLSACRYMTIVLAGLMQGQDQAEVLSPAWQPLQRLKESVPLPPEVEAVAAGSFRKLQPPEIQGSGYVVKSLEAALWAFHEPKTFVAPY